MSLEIWFRPQGRRNTFPMAYIAEAGRWPMGRYISAAFSPFPLHFIPISIHTCKTFNH